MTGLHWFTGALGASTCIRRGFDLNHDPIHGGQAVLKSGVTLQHGGRYPDQLQSRQPLFFPVARRRLELLWGFRFQRRPLWDKAVFSKMPDGDRELSSERDDANLARSARTRPESATVPLG